MFPGLRFSLLHQLAIRRGYRTVAEETGDTDRHQQPGGGRRCAASWSRRPLSSNPAHNGRRGRVSESWEDAAASCALMPAEAAIAVSDVELRTLGKLRRRIIPLLVLLYVVAYVDRINIGFAALTMNAALGITQHPVRIARWNLLLGLFHL
jgi:hypothetical protein